MDLRNVVALVEIRDLQMHFPLGGISGTLARLRGRDEPVLRAVDSVSFDVEAGETLGLVGESGCGKSTVARCLVRLLKPTAGSVRYAGKEIATLDAQTMRPFRRDIQMVFQDPTASLNPRLSVRSMVEEALTLHTKFDAKERRARVEELMQEVGLGRDLLDRYPHELSGGQRQRVNIARAIATNPRFVVLDEPTSALDVSLRSRAILLLEKLREHLGLSYLFISHDLATVKYLASRVAVMYLGSIVELSDTRDLFAKPLHPYTRALLAAVPVPDPDARRDDFTLAGEIPSPIDVATGCRLRGRCPLAKPICAEKPPLKEIAPGRFVACHLVSELSP
ncbi:ABC transporter ATP-binding protein [Bradyrhizobium sp. WSM 1738]|nr:ABC transporter ATP-binding protein [Bradyrhizobium hereditatis]